MGKAETFIKFQRSEMGKAKTFMNFWRSEMGKAKTFIKFQRSLVQKAETVIDFETAGTSFYVVQHRLYFGEISCETNQTSCFEKIRFPA